MSYGVVFLEDAGLETFGDGSVVAENGNVATVKI